MRLCWLLDLDLGGRTLHLSSRPVSFDGRQYEGGLDSVELRESLGQLGSLPDERSAGINVAPYADLAALSSDGHDIAKGRGTLRLWDLDEPEYRAEVHLIDGRITVPEIGGGAEILSLTLSGEPYDDTAAALPAEARITLDTWPNAPAAERGQVYPLPMGPAGSYVSSAGSTVRAPATPAYVVQYGVTTANSADKLIVSAEPTEATSVSIWYRVDDVRASYVTGTIVIEEDGLGRQVATVDISGEPAEVREAGEWWCAWSGSALPIYGSLTSGGVRTVGDLMLELIQRASVPVDVATWRQVASTFYDAAGYYIDDDTSPLEALLDIVGVMPVGMWSSPYGLAAVRLPTEARRSECVPLVEGRTAHRRGRLRLSRRPWEEVTSVRVGYAIDQARRQPREWVIRDVSPVSQASQVRSDVYVRTAGQGTESVLAVHSEDLDWTYDRATALQVATWLSRSRAVSPRVLTLQVPADLARTLRLGERIVYTAADLSLTEVVGIVTGRDITDRPLWEIEVSVLSSVVSSAAEAPTGRYQEPPVVPPPE